MSHEKQVAIAVTLGIFALALLALMAHRWDLATGAGWGTLTTLRAAFCESLERSAPCARCAEKKATIAALYRALFQSQLRAGRPAPPAAAPAAQAPAAAHPAPAALDPIARQEAQTTMFDFFSQLFGSKAGHAINSAVDTTGASVLEGAVPALAPVITAVTAASAHPAGTTATVTVTTPTGETFTEELDLAGKVLATLDSDFPEQLDGVVEALGAKFGAVGARSAEWLAGYANAKLETVGFHAPTVIAPPVAAAA